MEAFILVYFIINSFFAGKFYANEAHAYGSRWLLALAVLLWILFTIPFLAVAFLWAVVLQPFLRWCNVFFYWNLWFTDKFKDTPEEWLKEDNRYTRAIKKKYNK